MTRHVPGPYSFDPTDWSLREDANDWAFAKVNDPSSFGCSNEIERDQLTLELLATGRLLAAAPDLLVQLKGLLGFAEFVISAADIDVERTMVVLKNRGEAVAEVPISVLLTHSKAAVAKAEGR